MRGIVNNPLDEWYEKLGEKGLAFCVDSYNEANVRAYLEALEKNLVDQSKEDRGHVHPREVVKKCEAISTVERMEYVMSRAVRRMDYDAGQKDKCFNFSYLSGLSDTDYGFEKRIFGDVAYTIEQHMLRYKEVFVYHYEAVSKAIHADQELIERLKEQANLIDLAACINSIKEKYDVINSQGLPIEVGKTYDETAYNQIKTILMNQYTFLLETKNDLNTIYKKSKLESKRDILNKYKTICKEEGELKETINARQEKANVIGAKVQALEEEIKQLEWEQEVIRVACKKIEERKSRFESYQAIYQDIGYANQLIIETERYKKIKQELPKLVTIKKEWEMLEYTHYTENFDRKLVEQDLRKLREKMSCDVMNQTLTEIQGMDKGKEVLSADKIVEQEYIRKISYYDQLAVTYDYICQHQLLTIQKHPGITNLAMYRALMNCLALLEQYPIECLELEERLKQYETEEVSYSRIKAFTELIEEESGIGGDLLRQEIIDEIYHTYTNDLNQLLTSKKLLDQMKDSCEKALLEVKESYVLNEKEKKICGKALTQLFVEKNALQSYREKIIAFNNHEIISKWKGKYSTLLIYLEELLKEIEKTMKCIDGNIKAMKVWDDMKHKKVLLHQKEKRKKRCEQALGVLNTLEGLEEYYNLFIQVHIEAISEIFIALHMPSDYEALGIDEKEGLVGYQIKHGQGEKKKVPLEKMPIRQKRVIHIAILICMHMRVKGMPEHIFLDHPITCMDELDIAVLLKYFKKLVHTYQKQLFFTTTDDLMANLFRRKFSYLEHRFHEKFFFGMEEKEYLFVI